ALILNGTTPKCVAECMLAIRGSPATTMNACRWIRGRRRLVVILSRCQSENGLTVFGIFGARLAAQTFHPGISTVARHERAFGSHRARWFSSVWIIGVTEIRSGPRTPKTTTKLE